MKISFVSGVGMQVPMPLFSISYLAASIKASGRHQASLIDCYLKKNKVDYVLGRIREENPDVIGFSVMSLYVVDALLMAEAIKKTYPGLRIIFGGMHAILRPLEIMQCKAVDAVCVGEAEEVLVEFLDKLQEGRIPQVDGFWYRNNNGSLVMNESRPIIENLDLLPYPDWDIWDMKVYMPSLLYVLGSRGCPFSCTYCAAEAVRKKLGTNNPEFHYRVRSAGNIVGEIKMNVQKYGFGGFMPVLFSDSNFGLDRKQFREFTELYIKEGLHKVAPWRGMVVANAVDDDWACRAKKAGCFSIDMGLEHPDEKFRMEKLGKKITDDDFYKAITALRKYRIPYELSIIIGFTGETSWDIIKSIFQARRFKPLFLVTHIYIPFPETRLWELDYTKQKAIRLPYIEEKEGAFENCLLLAWWVKFLNQLGIVMLAIKLHRFELFSVYLKFIRKFFNTKSVDLVDFIRLVDHHIQQYYIYEVFTQKIKDRTYPFQESVFYRESVERGNQRQ